MCGTFELDLVTRGLCYVFLRRSHESGDEKKLSHIFAVVSVLFERSLQYVENKCVSISIQLKYRIHRLWYFEF